MATRRATGKGAAGPVAELPVLAFRKPADWAAWLEKHPTAPGLWLEIARKDSGTASITYPEAVEQALAWGWIDGQKKPLDAGSWLQKFTPRTARSPWSKINCAKAEALIAAGKMKPAGLREVERAKADGRWVAAYASQSKAEVPPDLAQALAANPRAAKFFETLESHNRYAILYRVHTAKRPETRAARIAQFVGMLAAHETLHPSRAALKASRAAGSKSP